MAEVLLTKAGTVRKKLPGGLAGGDWPGAICGLAPEFVARLKDCRKVPRELFAIQEVGALQDLILLLNAAWEIYDELCRKRGVLDFITVEEAALRLLSAESPADLLLRLDWRLRHILVDEFQDTSDNQKELLCRLLSGWSAGDGRTLTVVGDPKQSIYGWRQARLHLFLESREGLTCGGRRVLPLTPLSLTTNFRATPALITWVNRVAGGTVMADPQLSGGLVFAPAHPAPGREGGEAPCLALFSHEDTGEARSQEARWLTQRIIEARADLPDGQAPGPAPFSRRHLPTYLGALQAAGPGAPGAGGPEAHGEPGGAAPPQPGPGPGAPPGRRGLGEAPHGAVGRARPGGGGRLRPGAGGSVARETGGLARPRPPARRQRRI